MAQRIFLTLGAFFLLNAFLMYGLSWSSRSLCSHGEGERRAGIPHEKVGVVIAFVEPWLQKSLESIRGWEKNPPCESGQDRDSSVLILYSEVDWTSAEGDVAVLMTNLARSVVVQNCFSQVSFYRSNFTATPLSSRYKHNRLWTRYSNLLFYNLMLEDRHVLKNMGVAHVLWMGPDVVPVRAGWLTKVMEEAASGRYWVQGSPYWGKCLPQRDGTCLGVGKDLSLYVNGHALWNIGETGLVKLLTEVAHGKYWHWPYDVATLMHMQRVWSETTFRGHLPLYRHVEWIRSYGSYPVDWQGLPDTVFLVHYTEAALPGDVPDDQVVVPEQDKWVDEVMRLERSGSSQQSESDRRLEALQIAAGFGGSNGGSHGGGGGGGGGWDAGQADADSGLPDDPVLLRALNKAANKNKQVIIAVAGGRWKVFMTNFVRQLKKVGGVSHLMLVALDEATSKKAQSLKEVRAVFDLWQPGNQRLTLNFDHSLPTDEDDDRGGIGGQSAGFGPLQHGGGGGLGGAYSAALSVAFSPDRADVTVRNARYSILLRCLRLGFHVIVSDLDVAWLRDPFSYFYSNELDLQVQSDSPLGYSLELEGGRVQDYALNGGLIYAVAGPRTVGLFERLLREFAEIPKDPVDAEASNHAVRLSPASLSASHQVLGRLLELNPWRLQWRVLEPALFPNGALYFEQGLPRALSVTPISIHNNGVASPRTAVYRFRELQLWHMEPRGYNSTKGHKFMYYFDNIIDNGLNNMRQNLRTALAVSHLLNRTLILPVFHREHRRETPTTLDYYFDYEAFAAEFPEVMPHSFLEHRFPNWEQLPVQYIDNGAEIPSKAPWWPRAQVHHTGYYHLGSTEDEMLSWFKDRTDELLVMQCMLRKFGQFKDKERQREFERRVFSGITPNREVVEIREFVARKIREVANQDHFNCLHLRRGDFLKDHVGQEKSVPEIAELLKKYVPATDPLYVCTDAANEETRSAFLKAGFKHVFFVDDFYPKWKLPFVRMLNGRLSMRYGQIDQQICSISKTFVGNIFSTFTFHIGWLRQNYGFDQICRDIYDRQLGDGQVFI